MHEFHFSYRLFSILNGTCFLRRRYSFCFDRSFAHQKLIKLKICILLRWFGHVERMDDYRMARRVLMAEVSGGRVRGRPRLGWMDGVKVALVNRGMTVEAARQCAKDRKAWRALVHM